MTTASPSPAVGHELPATLHSNEDLCQTLDVTPEWIVEKTGIRARAVAGPQDSASGFAIAAARKAIAMAGIEPSEIDLIIVATFSGDYIFPPVSAKVGLELGARDAQIFDLQANCTGFVAAMTTASDRMRVDPDVRHALVIGTELASRYIDRTDANTAIFLADGAGAAILSRTDPQHGIISSAFHTDASNYEAVRMRGGGSSHSRLGRAHDPAIDHMEMNGVATWEAGDHPPAQGDPPRLREEWRRAGGPRLLRVPPG